MTTTTLLYGTLPKEGVEGRREQNNQMENIYLPHINCALAGMGSGASVNALWEGDSIGRGGSKIPQ